MQKVIITDYSFDNIELEREILASLGIGDPYLEGQHVEDGKQMPRRMK